MFGISKAYYIINEKPLLHFFYYTDLHANCDVNVVDISIVALIPSASVYCMLQISRFITVLFFYGMSSSIFGVIYRPRTYE